MRPIRLNFAAMLNNLQAQIIPFPTARVRAAAAAQRPVRELDVISVLDAAGVDRNSYASRVSFDRTVVTVIAKTQPVAYQIASTLEERFILAIMSPHAMRVLGWKAGVSACPVPPPVKVAPKPVPPPGDMIQVGETRETAGQVRVHLFRGALRITDIRYAGKRGKRCNEASLGWASFAATPNWVWSMLQAVLAASSYAQAAQAMKTSPGGANFFEQEHKCVRVQPGGFQEVVVRGPKVALRAGYTDFSVADLTDRNNEPRWIATSRTGVKQIRAFYQWAQANKGRIPQMTMSQIMHEAGAIGVHGHYYCAMD